MTTPAGDGLVQVHSADDDVVSWLSEVSMKVSPFIFYLFFVAIRCSFSPFHFHRYFVAPC